MTKPPASSSSSPAPDRADRLPSRVGEALAKLLAEPLAPGLYIVSTPIGNLADISLRALSLLARADLVFCEDTRHTRKLLSHFGIRAELEAYHEHNAGRERPRILARLQAGFSVALVADAGTPLISDPGYKLVRAALDQGLAGTSVPGPTAAIAALTLAGLPTDQFCFEGFLPPKQGARRKRLEALAAVPATLVFYEAPSRLEAALRDMAEILGAREGAVVKELTKLHERVARGPLETLADRVGDELVAKGEFVVLAGPPEAAQVTDQAIDAALAGAMDGQSLRDAARDVAEALGVSRNRVYALALARRDAAG
ncbi:MAG: 16S rRNA (cytidine(1402)-2'-O)-methyltransferase [Methyloligellaceae bacterium]